MSPLLMVLEAPLRTPLTLEEGALLLLNCCRLGLATFLPLPFCPSAAGASPQAVEDRPEAEAGSGFFGLDFPSPIAILAHCTGSP